jgi:hypothetical protein
MREPELLRQDSSWYGRLGEMLVVEALPNPCWHPVRLICYADGKVDFMVRPVDTFVEGRYDRPFRVLLDKDNLARDGWPSRARDGPRSMAVGQAVARRKRAAPAATVDLFEQQPDRRCSRRQDQ